MGGEKPRAQPAPEPVYTPLPAAQPVVKQTATKTETPPKKLARGGFFGATSGVVLGADAASNRGTFLGGY